MHESRPVIITAFANDRADGVRYLRNLPEETRRLRRALESADELCEHVILPNVTLEEVVDTLQAYRDRVAIFHYGGHANSYQLLLESSQGAAHQVQAAGLAQLLGQQRGLQLVFLNGCSTELQTDALLAHGVPCVIATTQAIDDRVATELSERFYQGLASGASIATAFAESVAEARAATGSGHRLLASLDDEESDTIPAQADAGRFPWFLRFAPGAERTGEWNLPAAADNPLFGLPPLPKQDLPESPYRSLQWFRREDADIFFGRGREVRDLFQLVTSASSPPVVLFYGLTGVGKSSVLDAGLLPRLESVSEAVYVRRDATLGLSGTLKKALNVRDGANARDVWLSFEQRRGKPLTIVLDQVEEAFTKPLSGGLPELVEFSNLLSEIFANPITRPQGRIVLGFRKEWFAEIDERLSEVKLPRSKVFLERLDRQGVIEVVSGPVRSPRLKSQYRLTLSDGLAEIIADDLLADPGAPVAPTLQILLTRLWNEARRTNPEAPRIDAALYQSLQRQGILLDDFLRQQLAQAERQLPQAVRSGFLLDLLAVHTTPLGTAAQWTRAELAKWYATQAQSGLLDEALQHCQANYLLSQFGSGVRSQDQRTSLMHDTLAPLVRERHDKSDLPGQRARRILDSRSVEWTNGKLGNPLDSADLVVVEQGRDGTRSWSEDELRLIEASRALREKVERQRRLLKVSGVGFTIALAIATGAAWWQTGRLSSAIGEAQSQQTNAERSAKEAKESAESARKAEADAKESEARALKSESDAKASALDAQVAQKKAQDAEIVARNEATSGHLMRAANIRSSQGDLLAAAHHLAAAAQAEPSESRKEVLGLATESMLRGVQLDALFENRQVVFDAWPLDGTQWCIWSGSPSPRTTELTVDGPEANARRSILKVAQVSREVFVNESRSALVRVAYGAKGPVLHIHSLNAANEPIVFETMPTGGRNALSGYRPSVNAEWLLLWGGQDLGYIKVSTGEYFPLPERLSVKEAAIGASGEWIWILTEDSKLHQLRREGDRFVTTVTEIPADAGTSVVDRRLLVVESAGTMTIHSPFGPARQLKLPATNSATEGEPLTFATSPTGLYLVGYSHEQLAVWPGVAAWTRDGSPPRRLDRRRVVAAPPVDDGHSPVDGWRIREYGDFFRFAFHPGGADIAIGNDRYLQVIRLDPAKDDAESPSAQGIYLEIPDKVTIRGLEFSPSGERLLAWTAEFLQHPDRMVPNDGRFTGLGAAFIFETSTGQSVGIPLHHSLPLQGARFGNSDEQVATWSADGQVRIWRLSQNKATRTHPFVPAHRRVMASSTDGSRVVTAAATGKDDLSVVEIKPSNQLPSPGSFPQLESIAFGPDDKSQLVVLGAAGRFFYRWNDRDWERSRQGEFPDNFETQVSINGGFARLWGEIPPSLLESLARDFASDKPAYFSVRRDSRHHRLLAWTDNEVKSFDLPVDLASGRAVLSQKWTFESDVEDAFLGAERSRVFIRFKTHFQVFEIDDGKPRSVPLGLTGISGLTLSPSGEKLLESGGADGRQASEMGGYARVWDARTFAALTPLMRHELPVRSAAFSSDERQIVTSTGLPNSMGITTAHVWNIDLGVEIVPPLFRPNTNLTYARFASGDDEILVWGGGRSDNLQLWDWRAGANRPSNDLIREVQRRTAAQVNRFGEIEFLSRKEWEQAMREARQE